MRNNDVRGADLSSRTAAARQEAQASLQEICNIQAQMDPRVQNLLFKDLTEHFNKKTQHYQNWLAVYDPFSNRAVSDTKAQSIQNSRSITDALVDLAK